MYNSFDPHIKITSNEGKTFNGKNIMSELKENEDILYCTDILEEKVLMKNGNREFIASIKGVGEDFNKMTNLESIIVEGESLGDIIYSPPLIIKNRGGNLYIKNKNVAVLGQGVAYHLSMGVGNMFNRLRIFVPNRESKTLLNPTSAFSSTSVLPIGIFSLGAEYDSKYIITPIDFLQDLLQKNEVSAIEINLKDESRMLEIQKYLQASLGENYKVSNRLQQHAVLHKILNSEKLGVFIILTFMLIIFTFNIIGSLSMLMIEKTKDIKTFWNLGATQKKIQEIFFIEGMLTIIIGSLLGVLLGLVLATIQMRYGIIGMGEGNFIIHSYPVSIHYADLIWVECTVLFIGFFASWYPARVLSKRLIKT
jgi:lipoprotein-releasing system permease protein